MHRLQSSVYIKGSVPRDSKKMSHDNDNYYMSNYLYRFEDGMKPHKQIILG